MMPKVKVTERCIVWTNPEMTANKVYDPAPEVLAPDAHIDEIVRQGKGERLTERGEASKGRPDAVSVGDAAS